MQNWKLSATPTISGLVSYSPSKSKIKSLNPKKKRKEKENKQTNKFLPINYLRSSWNDLRISSSNILKQCLQLHILHIDDT